MDKKIIFHKFFFIYFFFKLSEDFLFNDYTHGYNDHRNSSGNFTDYWNSFVLFFKEMA